ncbi:MAG: hypothetical protein RL233_214 [Bacteroidota bacterium]
MSTDPHCPNCNYEYPYPSGDLMICPECNHEWNPAESAADADAQKASLAIQGIQSQLSELTSEGNTLWRVRVGPYNSVEESNPVREKLNGMGIKSTVIKSSKS